MESLRENIVALSRGQLIFGVLCVLALIAIICGALFEIGRVRRESQSGNIVISHAQFRLRLLSALIWFIALATLAYCATIGLPVRENGIIVRGILPKQWAALTGGALLLVVIAVILLAYDVWRVNVRSRAQESFFEQQLQQLAQREIEHAQNLKKTDALKDAPQTESTGSDSTNEHFEP